MTSFKVLFICGLLVLSVAGQKKKDKKSEAANTRGHFQGGGYQGGNVGLGGGFGGGVGGGFGGSHHGGGFPGQGVGGFPGQGAGGFPGQGVGGFPGQGVGGFPGQGVGVGGYPGGNVGGGLGSIHAGLGGGNIPRPSTCRYWCKTPEGQAYCCEGNNEAPKPAITTQIVKGGQCPPVRAQCPLRSFGGPPRTCSNHGGCGGVDRCCFDRCLKEHVCKQPQYY